MAFLRLEAVQNPRGHGLQVGEHGVSIFLQRPDALQASFEGRDLSLGRGAGVL